MGVFEIIVIISLVVLIALAIKTNQVLPGKTDLVENQVKPNATEVKGNLTMDEQSLLEKIEPNLRGSLPIRTLREILAISHVNHAKKLEYFLFDLFNYAGYQARKTDDQYDGGRDVEVTVDGTMYWIEAKIKYLKTREMINTLTIQKLHSVITKHNHENNDQVKGVLITTHFVKYEARKYAHEVGIEMIDRKGLFELVKKVDPALLGDVTWEQDKKENFSTCEECGSFKIPNKSKEYGEFDGCVNYSAMADSCIGILPELKVEA